MITTVKEVRQNTNDGSSVHIDVHLQENSTYHTAGNLGVYPHNDPKYVSRVIERFKLDVDKIYDI